MAVQFRAYHICKAGGDDGPCNTVTPSTEWGRLHESMVATGQRWYCPDCSARYKPKYGMLVELRIGLNIFYALAKTPEDAPKDLERRTHCQTPEELLENLRSVWPLDSGEILRPLGAGAPNSFKITKEDMGKLPFLPWDQLYNLGVKPQVVEAPM